MIFGEPDRMPVIGAEPGWDAPYWHELVAQLRSEVARLTALVIESETNLAAERGHVARLTERYEGVREQWILCEQENTDLHVEVARLTGERDEWMALANERAEALAWYARVTGVRYLGPA